MLKRAPKICNNCIHYIKYTEGCGKFPKIDVITGNKSIPYARNMRNDEKKCGEEAIHYKKNQFKVITVPYYFIKYNFILLLPISVVAFYGSILLLVENQTNVRKIAYKKIFKDDFEILSNGASKCYC